MDSCCLLSRPGFELGLFSTSCIEGSSLDTCWILDYLVGGHSALRGDSLPSRSAGFKWERAALSDGMCNLAMAFLRYVLCYGGSSPNSHVVTLSEGRMSPRTSCPRADCSGGHLEGGTTCTTTTSSVHLHAQSAVELESDMQHITLASHTSLALVHVALASFPGSSTWGGAWERG